VAPRGRCRRSRQGVRRRARAGRISGPWSIALERQTLEARRHLISIAITATTFAALLVCVVIAALFVEVMLETSLKCLISAFFAEQCSLWS
jgi:hypothetical protein